MLSPPSVAGLGWSRWAILVLGDRDLSFCRLRRAGNVNLVPGRRKRLALIAAIMGSFVAGLDATAVNVALPAIRADLGGGLAGQQWISNAYLLSLGSLILVGGSLGDLYGERRVFSIGVGGFGVVSLLCAIAPSIGFLIACRALQGAFGALLMPSSLAVIVAAFPREERGGAIGSWTAWAGIATVIGPLAGGYLVDSVSWRLIFAVNIPFVIATLMLVSIAVPAARARLYACPRRLARRRAHVLRAGRTGARADPPAGRRMDQPPGLGTRDRRADPAGRVRRARAAHAGADAPARPVQTAQLRDRKRADVRDVRRPRDHVLPARAVPAGGRRLQRARRGVRAAALDDRDVPAVQAHGSARGSLRAPAVHGARTADGGGGSGVDDRNSAHT